MKAKREAYIANIKAQLDELNINLAAVEIKVANTKEAAYLQYKEEMAKLHTQSQQLREQLDEIKAASEDTWEDMISTTEKIRDAFINSFHFFQEQLKNKKE